MNKSSKPYVGVSSQSSFKTNDCFMLSTSFALTRGKLCSAIDGQKERSDWLSV